MNKRPTKKEIKRMEQERFNRILNIAAVVCAAALALSVLMVMGVVP